MADNDKRVQELTEKIKNLEAAFSKLNRDVAAGLEMELGRYQDVLTTKEKIAFESQAALDAQKDLVKATEQAADQAEALLRNKASLSKEEREKAKIAAEAANKLLVSKKEELKVMKEIVASYKTITAQSKLADDVADQITEQVFGINAETEKWKDAIFGSGNALKNTANILKNIGARLKKNLNFQNMAAAAAQKSYEMALMQIQTLKGAMRDFADQFSFSKAITAGLEEEDKLRMLARQASILTTKEMRAFFFDKAINIKKEFGVLREEAQVALGTLKQSFSSFRLANAETQTELAGTAALLQRRLSVNLNSTGQVMQNLSKTFGVADSQLGKVASRIAMLGQKMGDAQGFMRFFEQQSNTLAKYSVPNLEKSMGRLFSIQEKTGASVQGLLGGMETFSTFEGALDATSKLNAAFGSTIDGMELMDSMMTKGPAESLLLLRQRLEEGGIAFEDMNFAQRRLLAQTLQMDMGDLAGFMRTPFDELSEAVAKSDKTLEGLSKAQEELKKGTAEMSTQEERRKAAQEAQMEMITSFTLMIYDLRTTFTDFVKENPFPAFLLSIGVKIGLVGVALSALLSPFGKLGSMIGKLGGGAILGRFKTWATGTIGSLRSVAGAARMAGAAIAGMAAEYLRSKIQGKSTGAVAGRTAVTTAGYAATGAMIGSAIPGVGTLIGAGIGGAVGLVRSAVGEMAPGSNGPIDAPMIAKLGDANAPEIASVGGRSYMVGTGGPTATALPAGAAVNTIGSGGGPPTEITIVNRIIDKDGKIIGESRAKSLVQAGVKKFMEDNLNLGHS